MNILDINGFLESIKTIKNLKKLELSEINITYEEVMDMVDGIKTLEELTLHEIPLNYEDITGEIGHEPFSKLKKINLLHFQCGTLHFTNQNLIDLNVRLLKINKKCELYIEKTGILPQFPTKYARKKARHLKYRVAIKSDERYSKRHKLTEY